MAQCKAKSKRSGVRCKNNAVTGMQVCRMHGGKSLAGADSGTFVTGRYSKHLPDRLAGKYLEALADKDLIRLNEEIALVDTRLRDQLDHLAVAGMAANGWSRAKDAFDAFRIANASGRRAAMRVALNNLESILNTGADDAIAWKTILDLIESRRKLVETERRRLLDEDQVITVERLMIFVSAISDIIRRNVASREERGAVSHEVRLLVAGSDNSR